MDLVEYFRLPFGERMAEAGQRELAYGYPANFAPVWLAGTYEVPPRYYWTAEDQKHLNQVRRAKALLTTGV